MHTLRTDTVADVHGRIQGQNPHALCSVALDASCRLLAKAAGCQRSNSGLFLGPATPIVMPVTLNFFALVNL